MKYILIIMAFYLLLACDQKKISQLETEMSQLKKQNELIREQSASKDAFVEEYTSTLNEVYDNLEKIRKREGIITGFSQKIEGEKQPQVKQEMLNNIKSIDSYINRSKKKLSLLRSRFKESQITSKSFEETIQKLTKELEEKEIYIARLGARIDSLNQKVAEANSDIQKRDLIIEEQHAQLNVAHYIIGTDSELEQKNIITEKGGFIGIGTTTVLAENLDDQHFEQADILQTTNISIAGNIDDIEIISGHSRDSYQLLKTDEQTTMLEIKDPDLFWKRRYLVILTKS